MDLTAIFGNEIRVAPQPVDIHREYNGLAGVEGLLAMHLGSRGRQITISGTLRAATRPLLETAIASISNYLWADEAMYTFKGVTYSYVVFESLKLNKDASGKAIHWTAGGYATCSFTCLARALVL